MNYRIVYASFLLITLFCITSCFTGKNMSHPLPRTKDYTVTIQSLSDVHKVYPLTVADIESRAAWVKEHAQEIIDELEAIDPQECSKEFFLTKNDALVSLLSTECGTLELMQAVHPDKQVREAAEKHSLDLQAYGLDHISSNKKLYDLTIAVYDASADACTPEEKHIFDDMLRGFKKAGFGLADDQRARVIVLKKELNDLDTQFSKNINEDNRTIVVTKEELAGVPDTFVQTLEQKDGNYVLRMDYPTQAMVMGYCSVPATRKSFYHQFTNRAYPVNMGILDTVIAKRAELAQLLGYESYAHYDIDGQTMQTPEKAWAFETGLADRALKKAEQEFCVMTQDLPEGVQLSPDGKLYPWDGAYLQNYFKKKYYTIDEQKFAEYFPMQQTIDGLMQIYQQFFNIIITKVDAGRTWYADVQLLQIADKDGTVIGYVYLDMYPRPKKYGHAAQFGCVNAVNQNGHYYPAVVTLVCNFTKPTADQPSLLKYNEVVTFFHEFGHALHSILGSTTYAMQAGTSTERDFVELPSQMLENWMEQPEILKMISSHYKSGQPLPDDLIAKRLEVLQSETGMFVARQLSFGLISLTMFDGKTPKDTSAVMKKYTTMLLPFREYCEDVHDQCAFGHLMGYGASYYGYMWALVRGTDVFEQIKKEGLLNPAAGKRYVDCILGRGGSIDGNTMIRDYLGREATYDAFYEKMGFN